MNRSQRRSRLLSRRAFRRRAAELSLFSIALSLAGGLVPSPAGAVGTVDVNVSLGSGTPFTGSVDINCGSGLSTFTATAGVVTGVPAGAICSFMISGASLFAGVTVPGQLMPAAPAMGNVRFPTAYVSSLIEESPGHGPVDSNVTVSVTDANGDTFTGRVVGGGTVYVVDVLPNVDLVSFGVDTSATAGQYPAVVAPVVTTVAGMGPGLANPHGALLSIPVGTIDGTALFADGSTPRAGDTITITDTLDATVNDWTGAPISSVTTDGAGAFTFTELVAGTYVLHTADGYAKTVTLTGGQLLVTHLEADPPAPATGTIGVAVVDDSGNPIAGATISATDGVTTLTGVTDATGAWMTTATVGSWTVTGTAPVGYMDPAAPVVVTVADSTLSPLLLTMAAIPASSGVIAVTALDDSGNPVAGVSIAAVNGSTTLTGATDASGMWTASGPTGSYSVTAVAPSGYSSPAPTAIVVNDGMTTPVAFTLPALLSAPVPTPPPAAGSAKLNAALPVERLVDTRTASQLVMPGAPLRVHVADSATSAVVQLTADGATAPGFLTAYPCTSDVPLASNVNYVAGQPASASATVLLDAAGDVCVAAMTPVNVMVDRMAVYADASSSTDGRFVSVRPVRALDTRTDATRFAAGEERTISLPGVPTGATAVAINLTAVDSDGGWLAAYPAGTAYSGISNLNAAPGETRPNAVVVPVSADGKITIKSQVASDVVVDVNGYYTGNTDPSSTAGLFVPTVPTRVLDTRTPGAPWAGYEARTIATGVPADAMAVATTVTYLASGTGFVTAWAGGEMPLASNVNAVVDGVVPNMVNVGLSDGSFQLFTQSGGHIVVDVAGYFTA